MQLDGKTAVLTGAAGGMGQLIAAALAGRGCRLVLTDLNSTALNALQTRLGDHHLALAGDLCQADDRARLQAVCARAGGVDILINAAGISDFALLEDIPPQRLELLVQLNLTVPMLICQTLLPLLQQRGAATIVNIGSTFGAIGHPGFAAYCASKFGLRGFTEALRRELADSAVRVCYVAPRATRTAMNTSAVVELNETLGNAMDPPELVVAQLLRILEADKAGDRYLGWPEKLFVRINSVLPWLVDTALGKQLPVIKRFARI